MSNMNKKIISKTVLSLQSVKRILWKDIKDFKFEEDDYLVAGYVDPWENGSSNSGGGNYSVEVLRDVLETDEEFEKRIHKEEINRKDLKERRYQNYLMLKKEFESEDVV